MAHNKKNWTNNSPVILLGAITSVKKDPQASSAELGYGSCLLLPGELWKTMEKMRLNQIIRHGKPKVFISKGLMNSDFVLIRWGK